jgi:inner membrane protein
MDLVPLVWFILGVLIMGLEFLVPGFVIFFFGAGAVLVAGLTWLLPFLKDNIFLQLVIWLASSVATLGFFRRFFAPIFRGKEIKDKGEDEFVFKTAQVTENIPKNRIGRVNFQGTSWKAISYDENIAVGDTVEIMKKDNLTLVVRKVPEEQ